MDADNKSASAGVDIIAAVISNMNKELPMAASNNKEEQQQPQKQRALHLNEDHHHHHLDDLERSDTGDGSEKKDESTEKQRGKGGGVESNTSKETADDGGKDDSDLDVFVSASNKLIGYRYSLDELMDIASAACSKTRPEFVSNDSFKVSQSNRSTFNYLIIDGGGAIKFDN